MEERSQIREEIERTRDDLAEKASELSERASATAQKLRLSYHIGERPFAMVAISMAAGFVAQRLLFPRRPEPNFIVVSENELEEAPARVKRHMKHRRDDSDPDEVDVDGGRSIWHSQPVQALAAAGQMAAGGLVREVASRLVGQVAATRKGETVHH